MKAIQPEGVLKASLAQELAKQAMQSGDFKRKPGGLSEEEVAKVAEIVAKQKVTLLPEPLGAPIPIPIDSVTCIKVITVKRGEWSEHLRLTQPNATKGLKSMVAVWPYLRLETEEMGVQLVPMSAVIQMHPVGG